MGLWLSIIIDFSSLLVSGVSLTNTCRWFYYFRDNIYILLMAKVNSVVAIALLPFIIIIRGLLQLNY